MVTFSGLAKAQIALALCGWIWAFAYVLLADAVLVNYKLTNKLKICQK